MIPKPQQIECAIAGYRILKENMIVYLAMQERTGKTLTSILIAEMCRSVDTVQIITKKGKPLDGWLDTLDKYNCVKDVSVTNYHQAKNIARKPDLLILDESHNYISGFPKLPAMTKELLRISKNIPIIYISATPHPQGYQQLHHQFKLSSYSPWKNYKTGYLWFKDYGTPNMVWTPYGMRETYTKTIDGVYDEVKNLFVIKTRAEMGFEFEPVDKLHYIELSDTTKHVYNTLLKHKIMELKQCTLVCDSRTKLRASLHMLEGGVGITKEKNSKGKLSSKYHVFNAKEKIDYIMKVWGDVSSLVIFYHYIAEGEKLRSHFKNAEILQGTTNAEGVELSGYDTVVVYSQDWSTAKYVQRRARQASQARTKEIIVHFLLVKNAVSEQCYTTVALNKVNFVDSTFKREEI